MKTIPWLKFLSGWLLIGIVITLVMTAIVLNVNHTTAVFRFVSTVMFGGMFVSLVTLVGFIVSLVDTCRHPANHTIP